MKSRPIVIAIACAATATAAAAGLQAREANHRSVGSICERTPQIPGGEYKRGAPLRRNLRTASIKGVLLTVRGRVLDAGCNPVVGALLDFWHADAHGHYDMKGFRLRGRQYTDAQARYVLFTIVPGHFFGRTLHIHVKLRGPGLRSLENQLFFPAWTRAYGLHVGVLNSRDRHGFNPKCIVHLAARRGNRYQATFDFVLAPA